MNIIIVFIKIKYLDLPLTQRAVAADAAVLLVGI